MPTLKRSSTIARAVDSREIPAYTIAEAAHYLLIPLATLRSWVLGRHYPVESGQRFFHPVLSVPPRQAGAPAMLSFVNLIEAHVLDSIRRQFQVGLPEVRVAVKYLRNEFRSPHPLADHRIETDGRDLFVRSLGKLITVSRGGQLAMPELIDAYLRRIERDPQGLAIRLYPFTRKRTPNEPRLIVIDPRVSFGRPVLVGTGIQTGVIAERYKAGESIADLAQDYGRNPFDIEEAIRCELAVEAA
jgi:uncharacterized protein (DUF433 family)